jgi:uncharacterized membrane protein YdjX (TVP38/TMEM64 family)
MWRGRCQTAAVFIPPPAALRGHSFALGRFPARVGHGSMSTASSRVALAPPLAARRSRASRRSTPAVVSAAVRGPRDCGKKRTTRHDDDVVTSPPRLGAPPAPWSCAAVGLWASAVPPSRAAESLAAMSALTGGDAAALIDRARDALDALETLPQIETVPLWWAVLTISELVPLLPTQPLALTSGIAFGAAKGTAVVFAANVAAATLAFLAAKGFGRALAERVVEEETGGGGDEASSGAAAENDDEKKKNAFREKWRALQLRLAASGPVEQTGLIALFRLTPHPFSASNYLFGLTDSIRLAPYVVGTAVGVAPWAALYSCIGAYGRGLLDGGEAVDAVFEDLGAVIESDVEIGEEGLLAVGLATLAIVAARRVGAEVRGRREREPNSQTRR